MTWELRYDERRTQLSGTVSKMLRLPQETNIGIFV